MSVASRLLRGSRALFAGAKSGTSLEKPVASASASKKLAAAAAGGGSKATSATKKRKVTNSGITKEMPISPVLQGIVGAEQISRAQASKKIWEYIKINNLQNPSDKRVIMCDAKLKQLFDGKDKVGFLEVAKLLSPHFLKTK
ncbi:upstream activation factor subunit spp27-like [Andrographis paniculata]|uniref:upstream activation factor subunit spp27-like n=1 Tax=Andrographis paniculata TaxID=175694 RepID=UPI0021E94723|nr:upstream activation factor subunit spp27-like [Andrographis paniculata]